MPFFDGKTLPKKEPIPGITLCSAYLDNVMITMVELAPGAVLPAHSHPHEQISYCVSGELELRVGNETRKLGPGQGATVGANVEHGGVTGPEGAFVIDSWSPIRQDYIVEE